MSDSKGRRGSREAGFNETGSAEQAVERAVEATEAAMAQSPAAPTGSPISEPQDKTPRAPVQGREEPPVERLAASADETWAAFGEAQLALVHGFGEVAAEWAGIAQSGIAAGADAAVALLGAKTIAEAVEIQAGLASRGFNVAVEGAAKLSEIGVKAATEASRTILTRLGAISGGLAAG